jgi:hypothetical protein
MALDVYLASLFCAVDAHECRVPAHTNGLVHGVSMLADDLETIGIPLPAD